MSAREMEQWIVGDSILYSITPLLQYSITPVFELA
jgi:hypothetical protein